MTLVEKGEGLEQSCGLTVLSLDSISNKPQNFYHKEDTTGSPKSFFKKAATNIFSQ